MTNRREFLTASAALAGASAAGFALPALAADRKLSILFLGGTGFIGPKQIEYTLARGHDVSMFNRGSNPGLFGDRVEELIGNRDATIDDGLKALEGSRTWDVVVDNSGYVPRHVRDSAELLKGRCGRYVYVSTTGVYDFDKTPSVTHESPLHSEFPDTEEVTGATYGPLKAECDLIVQEVYGDTATIIRPTVIVGPGDSTDRFTYWVERFHRGGDIVCPPDPRREAAWIDVRDLAKWLVTLAEEDRPGIFNAAGPASVIDHEQVMYGFRAFSAGPVRLHWPSRELVDETGFRVPWFWSGAQSRHIGVSASIAAGLTYRSLATTIRDTHEWWLAQPAERREKARGWPTEEQERAVLERIAG
ncbi:MAG: NAD-dependent epimerase/dehydratase family protein [Woeseiaceae bacterium]|jgi:2'-hydroxyisoflavone reductase|nr:NAD-dependent epimerase/dehydratase family protein [Woeseiaceae bacterium]